MSYTHLSEQERVCIFYQRQMEFSPALIGQRIGRHRATISRELKRFRKAPIWPYYRFYLPDHAHRHAQQQRRQPRGCRWVSHAPLLAYVQQKLAEDWSPEQIAGRLPLDYPQEPKMRLSHQSIYRWIRADRQAGGSWWKRLRQSCRKRRKRYGSGPRKSRIPNRVGIDQRPAEAQQRSEPGHWEADTVLGTNGRLATHVDRMTRYVLIARLPDGTACQFNAATIRHFRKLPRSLRKSHTSDNGSEFVEHQKLSSRLGFRTFFANPYHCWERGTNENTNGLIRQYFPKHTDFSLVSYQRVAKIQQKLNNRPRKCLGYRTPAEVLGPALRLKC